MSAAHHNIANITAIVDRNHIQNDGYGDYERLSRTTYPVPGGWVGADGHTVNIMNLEPLADKWRAFGWRVQEVDGHNVFALIDALEKAKGSLDGPSVIIAQTIKGKGVSYMENNPAFHGKAPNQAEYEKALAELAR
jgi:transketolase